MMIVAGELLCYTFGPTLKAFSYWKQSHSQGSTKTELTKLLQRKANPSSQSAKKVWAEAKTTVKSALYKALFDLLSRHEKCVGREHFLQPGMYQGIWKEGSLLSLSLLFMHYLLIPCFFQPYFMPRFLVTWPRSSNRWPQLQPNTTTSLIGDFLHFFYKFVGGGTLVVKIREWSGYCSFQCPGVYETPWGAKGFVRKSDGLRRIDLGHDQRNRPRKGREICHTTGPLTVSPVRIN